MQQTINLPLNTTSIGILSDSHGYLDHRILDALNNVDLIFHAGDIMDKIVIKQLNTINASVFYVTGNNDIESVWPKNDAKIVNAIPESLTFTLGTEKIGLIHGHQFGSHKPDHDKIRQQFKDCRLVVYGHTHHQTIDTSSKPWVINPGASGKIRTHGGASCLILTIDKNRHWQIKTIKFVDNQIAA